jgi:hypothetical protein
MPGRLTKITLDASTNVETIVELTDEEMAQVELDRAKAVEDYEKEQADKEAYTALKASAKAKLISGQPLTSEEADTLVL